MNERSRVRVPAGAAGDPFLQGQLSVLTLILTLISVSVSTPLLLQWLVKDRRHSAKSALR